MKITKIQPTPPPPPPTEYVLSMSYREAYVLRAILECVGGDPAGPRAVANDLFNALDSVGIRLGGERGGSDRDLLDRSYHSHAIHLVSRYPDRLAGL